MKKVRPKEQEWKKQWINLQERCQKLYMTIELINKERKMGICVQGLNKLQSYQNICDSSMENIEENSNKLRVNPPVRPLQGYFRFRHQMMSVLQGQGRNSESIVRSWNQLTEEQRAIMTQETKLDMHRYEQELIQWKKQQENTLRPLENTRNTTNLTQPSDIQQKNKMLQSSPCRTEPQNLPPTKKGKLIRKASTRKGLKKHSSQY